MMMSRGVPFLLQGIPPSALESFKIQVEEEGNRYVIRGFLPGVRPQDLDVQLDDSRTLKISALRRDQASGQTVAAISRNTILPKHADPLEVEAHLDPVSGNLTIQVMKVGEMLNRKRMRLG